MPLTPDKKRFNQLLAKIEKARARLAAWQEQVPLFTQSYAQQARPELDALALAQRAWLDDLDAALERPGWTLAERDTLRETLCELAGALIDSADEDEQADAVKSLFNKHSPIDFDTQAKQELQSMRSLLETVGGVELGDDDLASADELLERAHAGMRARAQASMQAEEHAHAGARKRPVRPSAAQRRREEEARQITQTVREVFRKLASALHPDRATDAADHDARTAMMKRVNRAYEASDLLALLELQLEIEQVDSSHIANASAKRVRYFNKVLSEQLDELEREIDDHELRFCAEYGLLEERRLDPLKLAHVLEGELRQIRMALSTIERDRKALLDKPAAKRWLKRQPQQLREDPFDDFFS